MDGLEKEIAEKLISELNGVWISKRDGAILFFIKSIGAVVWVRTSPISERGLKYVDNVLSRYKSATKWRILLRLYDRADYVKETLLKRRFIIIDSVDKLKEFVKEKEELQKKWGEIS